MSDTHTDTDTRRHTEALPDTIPDGAPGTEVLTLAKMEEADVTQRTLPHPASSLPPQPPDPLSPQSPVWIRRSAVQDSLLWVLPVVRAGPCRGHQAFQEEALKTPRVAAVWGQSHPGASLIAQW